MQQAFKFEVTSAHMFVTMFLKARPLVEGLNVLALPSISGKTKSAAEHLTDRNSYIAWGFRPGEVLFVQC